MDDLTYFISATGACGKRIPLIMIPMPVVCGPTSGKNLREEFKEWYFQGIRWTIGAAETLHYLCIKAKTL
eukprot:Pgem_evm1s11862